MSPEPTAGDVLHSHGKTRLFTPWLTVPGSYSGSTMDDGRAEMQLTAADLDAFYAGGDEWTEVTDQATGTRWLARRADCGAGCRCAAEAKPVPEPGDELTRITTKETS